MLGENVRGISTCRGCLGHSLREVLSLPPTPMANYLPPRNLAINEPKYPLDLRICNDCGLGQIGEFESPEQIFSDYPYLSSTSKYWVNHAIKFASDLVNSMPQLSRSYIFEIASNDGYLLEQFHKRKFRVLGIEPAANIAPFAEEKGIETIVEFFGQNMAEKILISHGSPSLIIANNVAAHVPDMIDFFRGISILCDSETLVSIENPTFGTLIENRFYDTIYHEHFSYLSVKSISAISSKVGLELFQVENLPTHGGSFRYWLRRKKLDRPIDSSVSFFEKIEEDKGFNNVSSEKEFASRVLISIRELQEWVNAQQDGSIIGYGAAAKTVTTFFGANLQVDKFQFIVDANVLKQGRRLPGTNLEIVGPEKLKDATSRILIFPWNIAEEIVSTVSELAPKAEIWTLNPMRRIK